MGGFISAIWWYVYLLFLGVIFLPLVTLIFKPFIDKGYAFAKTIAILFISYLAFLLGTLHVLPFSLFGLFLIVFVFGLAQYFKLGRDFKNIFQNLSKRELALIGFEEIVFFVSFFVYLYVRSHQPAINGLEKFMDYGFMKSILRSDFFPPLDMWYSSDPTKPSGYPINYYYFGHLTGAVLMKLTSVNPTIAYNLILGTIFAQGITLGFSLCMNIIYLFQKYAQRLKSVSAIPVIIYGLMGTFLINLAGNFHTIYLFTTGYPNDSPEPFWNRFQSLSSVINTMQAENLGFLEALSRNSSYWYPNATRFIPNTIHEFPSYSYVVADLHGHVFDIPFVLLTIAAVVLFLTHYHFDRSRKDMKKFVIQIPYLFHKVELQVEKKDVFFTVTFGAMLAVHYMTNAFDAPIYFLLLTGLYLITFDLSQRFFRNIAILVTSFIILSLPFSYFFEPFASGIGVNCSPQFLLELEKIGPFIFETGKCQATAPWMLFILWGFFFVNFLFFIATNFLLDKKNKKEIFTEYFFLLMFLFSFFLILIPEFFYIKDIYPDHFRANTMFKMGYQAFILLSVASTFTFYHFSLVNNKIQRWGLKVAWIGCFILVAIYPLLAFNSYYPVGKMNRNELTLQGDAWMETSLSTDKEIIDFINMSIPGQPNILEAQGDSYTEFNRVSAYTGLPTVAGWWVHEWLWRGTPEIVGNRIPEIETMYQSPSIEETWHLLQKYNVAYVVVSGFERQKYPNIIESKFETLGERIFISKNGSGALYKVNEK